MKLLLLTPPLVQLNTPYPATTSLTGFLLSRGVDVVQADLSLEFALRVFSRAGLERIAEVCHRIPDAKRTCAVRFFLDHLEEYLTTIESVISFLQGNDEAVGWRIGRRDYLPEGGRFAELSPSGSGISDDENLSTLFGDLGVADRAKYLASLYLDDLSDAIREGIDPSFGLARYAESLSVSAATFDPLLERLRLPPNLLDGMIDDLADEVVEREKPEFVGLTVPFPGTLYAALRIALLIRQRYPRIRVVMGGGYVNTELRYLSDERIFDYVDDLCFDEGYAPMLGVLGLGPSVRTLTRERLMSGKGMEQDTVCAAQSGIPSFVKPSYAGLDLRRYLNVMETANPMHRIWSDGKWMKLQLANGCYWHRCAFCDVSLDYIQRYLPPHAEEVVRAMRELKAETGQSGFHFTDEAIAPSLARRLSEAIIADGLTVTWWGNIRFEKAFTPELCQLMARAGCIAVTGGLECAQDRLLKLMNKGITLASATHAMRAFSDAGILVHAYLMYGFPTQTDEETIEALEFVRKRFAEGSLQSAFWHRFALTAHSPIARQPETFGIRILPEKPIACRFAENEIPYESDVKQNLDRLGKGLRLALYNYMMGLGLDVPVREWFRGGGKAASW